RHPHLARSCGVLLLRPRRLGALGPRYRRARAPPRARHPLLASPDRPGQEARRPQGDPRRTHAFQGRWLHRLPTRQARLRRARIHPALARPAPSTTMRGTIHIRAVGMACPIGLKAITACAAMRAGINRFAETQYLGNDGQPVVASYLDRLGWDLSRRERWLKLLWYALRDLCDQHERGLAMLEHTPIVLAAPLESHAARPSAAADLAGILSNKLGVALDPRRL